jgi:hypothetical protein
MSRRAGQSGKPAACSRAFIEPLQTGYPFLTKKGVIWNYAALRFAVKLPPVAHGGVKAGWFL